MDTEEGRQLLEAERERIERALKGLGHEDDGDLDDDSDAADRGTDTYQDEFDEGRAGDLREQLEAVERAEARLAAGTYGLSIKSGEAIPDDRLRAVPTAELTVDEERARQGG
jgi:DnaK suppressor protein